MKSQRDAYDLPALWTELALKEKARLGSERQRAEVLAIQIRNEADRLAAKRMTTEHRLMMLEIERKSLKNQQLSALLQRENRICNRNHRKLNGGLNEAEKLRLAFEMVNTLTDSNFQIVDPVPISSDAQDATDGESLS